MNTKGEFIRPKVFGSTAVNTKGQVVIPANARKELGIEPGNRFLVFGPAHGQGLVLLKIDALEEMLDTVSQQLASFGSRAKGLRDTTGSLPKRKGH